MKRPPGMKRPRDQEQEEALDQEEYEARGDLSLITINGPPWYDEYTGDELPDSEVQEAMANEKQSLQKHDTYHKVKEEEKDVPGTEMVHTRWLLHRKPSTHKVKARLVAQQVRYGRDELDTLCSHSVDDWIATLDCSDVAESPAWRRLVPIPGRCEGGIPTCFTSAGSQSDSTATADGRRTRLAVDGFKGTLWTSRES
jgi:hypothetical protein